MLAFIIHIIILLFIFRFLVLIFTSNHPVTVSLFFSQNKGVVSLLLLLIFYLGFLIDHECDHSFESLLKSEPIFWAIILVPYTPPPTPPPREPASVLILCIGDDAIDGEKYCRNTSPIYPLLATGGPPVKIRPGSLYDDTALIAPEGGNTRGIWHPPCYGHQLSGCRSWHNCLAT